MLDGSAAGLLMCDVGKYATLYRKPQGFYLPRYDINAAHVFARDDERVTLAHRICIRKTIACSVSIHMRPGSSEQKGHGMAQSI